MKFPCLYIIEKLLFRWLTHPLKFQWQRTRDKSKNLKTSNRKARSAIFRAQPPSLFRQLMTSHPAKWRTNITSAINELGHKHDSEMWNFVSITFYLYNLINHSISNIEFSIRLIIFRVFHTLLRYEPAVNRPAHCCNACLMLRYSKEKN